MSKLHRVGNQLYDEHEDCIAIVSKQDDEIMTRYNLFPELVEALDMFVTESDWDLDPVLSEKLGEAVALLRKAKV